jgi:hypothetical protein
MENSANTKNRVTQDSGGKKSKEGKGAAPSKGPAPRWCPRGITKTQKRRLQKIHQRELEEKKEGEEQDYWFKSIRPMTKPKQTWWKKRLDKEEGCSSGDRNGEEASKVTSTRGEGNPGSGDENLESGNCNPEMGNCHTKLGNRNLDSGNSNMGKEGDRQGEELVLMDVNMVFTIPVEFRVPTEYVTELALGEERAVFEKLENLGAHMKPLFIRGHLDGTTIGHMLIDGGASVNILPMLLFKKLSHVEGDLKQTNLSLSAFAGDPTREKILSAKR